MEYEKDRIQPTSPSWYGTNLGVEGTTGSPAFSSGMSSWKILIEPFEPEVTLDFFVVAGGGGILLDELPSSEASTNTAILGVLLVDAVRLDFPGCLSVVPAALLTSGTFSFTRDLRVPSSAHGAGATSGLSSPDGSMKICIRPFGRGTDGVVEDAKGAPNTSCCDCLDAD